MLFWERNLDSNQCRYSSDATRAGVSRGIRDLIQMGDDQGLSSQPPGMSQALHPHKVLAKGCWESSFSSSRKLRRNRGALTDHAQPLALPGLAWATGMCFCPAIPRLSPRPLRRLCPSPAPRPATLQDQKHQIRFVERKVHRHLAVAPSTTTLGLV